MAENAGELLDRAFRQMIREEFKDSERSPGGLTPWPLTFLASRRM